MIEKVKQLYKDDPQEFILKAISYLLSSFVLPNIVFLMFLIYMGHNKFFSYDFFVDGIFGMKIFFLISIWTIFILSILTTGSLITSFGVRNNKVKKRENYIFVFSNLLVLLLICSITYENFERIMWSAFLYLISICINFHISMLIFYKAKQQLISFIIVSVLIIFTSIQLSTQTSDLLSIGLRTFGTGGEIKTVVQTKEHGKKYGKLILLTPETVYLKEQDNNGTLIFPINNISYIHTY